ncbi:MAG: alternative ribosome rescue aminoacyl-tRNA hydrolase ArfB [Gemmatimonadota bacterium]|nr:alternative ribosome rescue aminoacyl-tRNA hydrolase ArfB [Gemmatimonadota bacterium]
METLYVSPTLSIPLSELRFKFRRSSGPGGQNVNKLNTSVELQYDFVHSAVLSDEQRQRIAEKLATRLNSTGALVIQSERFRTQGRNRTDCLDKLAALLAEALKTQPKRKKTKPSRAAQARRLDSKRRHSEKKKNRQTPLD